MAELCVAATILTVVWLAVAEAINLRQRTPRRHNDVDALYRGDTILERMRGIRHENDCERDRRPRF